MRSWNTWNNQEKWYQQAKLDKTKSRKIYKMDAFLRAPKTGPSYGRKDRIKKQDKEDKSISERALRELQRSIPHPSSDIEYEKHGRRNNDFIKRKIKTTNQEMPPKINIPMVVWWFGTWILTRKKRKEEMGLEMETKWDQSTVISVESAQMMKLARRRVSSPASDPIPRGKTIVVSKATLPLSNPSLFLCWFLRPIHSIPSVSSKTKTPKLERNREGSTRLPWHDGRYATRLLSASETQSRRDVSETNG